MSVFAVRCQSCGATLRLLPDIKIQRCDTCHDVVACSHERSRLRPETLRRASRVPIYLLGAALTLAIVVAACVLGAHLP